MDYLQQHFPKLQQIFFMLAHALSLTQNVGSQEDRPGLPSLSETANIWDTLWVN